MSVVCIFLYSIYIYSVSIFIIILSPYHILFCLQIYIGDSCNCAKLVRLLKKRENKTAACRGCLAHGVQNCAEKADHYVTYKLGEYWQPMNILITKLAKTAIYDILHAVMGLTQHQKLYIPSTSSPVWMSIYKKLVFITKYKNQLKTTFAHQRASKYLSKELLESYQNNDFWFRIKQCRIVYTPFVYAMSLYESYVLLYSLGFHIKIYSVSM